MTRLFRPRPTLESLAAKYAPAPRETTRETPERDSRDTAEYLAACESSGLPQKRRHRGVWLADGAPERWECDE